MKDIASYDDCPLCPSLKFSHRIVCSACWSAMTDETKDRLTASYVKPEPAGKIEIKDILSSLRSLKSGIDQSSQDQSQPTLL